MKPKMTSKIVFHNVEKIKQELDINEYCIGNTVLIVFKNPRIRGNKVIGVRLTKYGLTLMQKSFTSYNFKLENFKLSNKAVVKLDQTMQWLYFVDNKKLVLFSEKDPLYLN